MDAHSEEDWSVERTYKRSVVRRIISNSQFNYIQQYPKKTENIRRITLRFKHLTVASYPAQKTPPSETTNQPTHIQLA
jgi:hypothetical protein